MSELARDTFTDVAYRSLPHHTEEINTAIWSQTTNSNQLLISPNGKLFRSAWNPALSPIGEQGPMINGADGYLSYAPPTGDYKLQYLATWLGDYLPYGTPPFGNGSAQDGPLFPDQGMDTQWTQVGPPGDVRWINANGVNNNPNAGTNHRFYGLARVQAGNPNQCYSFGYETTSSRYVLCKDRTDISVDGPAFDGWNLTATAPAWTVGETRLFELVVNGTTLTFNVNGVPVITTTQTDYASGKAGLLMKGGSSPIKGFHLDDFKILSLSGGGGISDSTTTLQFYDKEAYKVG